MSLSDSIRDQLVASLTNDERTSYETCRQQLHELQSDFRGNGHLPYARMNIMMNLLRTLKAKRQDTTLDGAAMTLYGELGRTLLDDPGFQQAMGIAEDPDPEKEKTFAATQAWDPRFDTRQLP